MPSKYQIWLTYNGETEKIRLPVLPENINVDNGSDNKSIDIQGLGEVTIKQDPKATVISFSCFFPANIFPGIQFTPIQKPNDLIEKILIWKNSDIPVHFIVTDTKLNLFCTIENFTYIENGADINYSITLKEYREIHVRQVKISDNKAIISDDSSARTDSRAPAKTYTVIKGDCLWTISKEYLGDSSRWSEIYNLNMDIIKNPNLIYPGQVLKLPV